MNSVDLRDWQKVLVGFLSARIPHEGIDSLTGIFNRIDRNQAERILGGGHYGQSNDEHRESRNLFRALNFLLAVRALDQRLAYAVDEGRKSRFATGASNIGALRQEVLAEYHKIFPPAAPAPAIPVPVVSNVITPARTPVPRTRNTTIKQLESALGMNSGGRTVLRAVERFKEGGSARQKVIGSFRNNAAMSTGWANAKQEIYNRFAMDREFWLARFTILHAVLDQAYANFNRSVADSKVTIQARLDLIGSLFGALKHCPPPVSILGVIGEKAMSQFKPDNYNPASKYEPLRGAESGGIVNKIAAMMEQKERALTLVNCANIDKQASLSANLSRAAEAWLREMQYIVTQALDEVFGRNNELDARLDAVKATYLDRAGLAKQGPAAHQSGFFDTVIRQYKDETIAQIDAALGWQPTQVDPEDLRIAIEMRLYSEYVIELFGSAPSQAKDAYSLPVAESIVNFFAQNTDWGILALDMDDHAQSNAIGRLNWKGGKNHMKALEMFCGWYARNINPFMLVAGTLRDGEKYSPALIKKLCREHVAIINRAISSGRTVSRIFGSSWNWQLIGLEYRSQTGALDREWESV